MSERVVGLDLGTTHCALAVLELGDARDPRARPRPEVLSVPQLAAPGELTASPLLPSFLYFRHASEASLALPWDASVDVVAGEYARRRASEAPLRVVSSAKSWLCHPTADRRAPMLPLGAPEDVEKVSPVEASFRFVDHLAEALRASERSLELGEHEVVLTVPASFDAAARELTAEAAYAAGLTELTLLEEPQAALYAWLDTMGEGWREHLHPGDVVLVVDVGGGTSDFSAITALEQDGALELRRIAVGEHILLGGDNMDLALAYAVQQQLGQQLDRWQLGALTHGCRAAKERLLGDARELSVPVVVPSRGSALLGGTLRAELSRGQVEALLVDGFFPRGLVSDVPAARSRAALSRLALPYATDPAVTKHLAAFLARQAGVAERRAGAGAASSRPALLHPTAVLFNGGVFKAEGLRRRTLDVLNGWLEADGAPAARELPGADLDLAVARGAAYYGAVKRGRGLRIRGGIERSYYVGIESPAPAVPGFEPAPVALCVAPFGMEEGTEAALPPNELFVVVGEPVEFRFFGSTVRQQDAAGVELEPWSPAELDELSPLTITLPAEGREPGSVVPVQLRASVTAVGTLLVEAVPLAPVKPNERWKVELSVRQGEG